MQTAAQVARRAVAMTALAFRASMEVTDHPRSAELSHEIPRWLERIGVASELMPYEQDLLNTPYGGLDSSQSREANWSGEGAWVLAWAIGLVERPAECEWADYHALFERLRIMRPEVREVLAHAAARPAAEWVRYGVETWALRSELQLRMLQPDSREPLASIQSKRLEALGLSPDPAVIERVVRLVDSLTDEERKRAAGPVLLREHAIFWLLNDSPVYYDD